MKKVIVIILLVLMLGCSMDYYICANPGFGMSADEIGEFVKTIQWRDDFIDKWDSPKEIIRDMKGDCEEYCILYLYLMKVNYGVEYKMVFVIDGSTWHHTVKTDNGYFDPVINRAFDSLDNWVLSSGTYNWTPITEYTYDEVMERATSFGTRNY